MPVSKNSFLDHVRLFRQAAAATGSEAIMAFDSMNAFVRSGNTHWAFHPRFMAEIDGVRQYVSTFSDSATMFAGWLPYQLKRWPIAHDKLAFKRHAQSAGLRTPAWWLEREGATDAVGKKALSSFGAQIRGPFRSGRDQPLDVTQGEYFEAFITGKILKIWYWNERPICAEVDQMPDVVGNGVLTLAELIVRRANGTRRRSEDEKKALLARCEPLLHYFNLQLSSVLPKGVRQVVEFRYGTTLMQPRDRRVVDLTAPHDETWTSELAGIGEELNATITPEIRDNTLFTVDAILDASNTVWLLEMNCNPAVHPLVYPVMLEKLLASGAQAPGLPAAGRLVKSTP